MKKLTKFTDSRDVIFNDTIITRVKNDNSKGILKFGVAFLDEALLGIGTHDLVLLGAPSGAGKTELATHIAFTNAMEGKRVVYFALEAEQHEIELRTTYKYKALAYYKNGGREYTAYDRWIQGDCEHIEKQSVEFPKIGVECLRTRYVSGAYSITDFLQDYTEIVNSSDLVILDHIHYFDLETENENREYKEIIKKIRTQVLENGKPIVVVSHIKKKDRRFPTLAPDQEDFHGSSDLVKMATKVISISPQYDFSIYKKTLDGGAMKVDCEGYTFIKASKNRRNGLPTRYISATKYDFRTNSYHKPYYLGSQKLKDKETIFLAEHDVPKWAESAITN